MPELPEVETVVRELRPLLVGRRIENVRAGRHRLRRPWSRRWNAEIARRKVLTVDRRGKWILLNLEDERVVVMHLGMTGQLRVLPAAEPSVDHTHLVFSLDGGERELRFRDVRRFGSATVFADPSSLAKFFEDGGLGPEPFDLQPEYWTDCLRRTRRCLKAVLLDQRILAGVGNIYADESLFEARLHPARAGQSLEPIEAKRLRKAIVTVLRGPSPGAVQAFGITSAATAAKGRIRTDSASTAGPTCPASAVGRISLAFAWPDVRRIFAPAASNDSSPLSPWGERGRG